MTELSLNVLDIAQNSVKAKASLVEISVLIDTKADSLDIVINDNGCGMTKEQVEKVTDPFYTTRTTRKVGLGIPFFKMAAEMTGGSFKISSELGKGTLISASFILSNIDRMPLGNMCDTIESLIVFNTDMDFIYTYKVDDESFTLSTVEMKQILDGVPLNTPEVVQYIVDYLNENTQTVNKENIF